MALRVRHKRLLLHAAWLFLGCAAFAQQPISIYATAIDRSNVPVHLQPSQLEVKNFTIASVVPVKPAEISCVVVWDSSNSERYAFDAMKIAATDVLKKLLVTPQRCTFVDFDNESRVATGSTNDPKDLIKVISRSKPGGGTAAYDAVIAGSGALNTESLPVPRVMYLFSDFEDNQSHHTREEMMDALVKGSVRVYAFAPESKNSAPAGTAALSHMATETGGRLIIVPLRSKPDQMERALDGELDVISAELKSWVRIDLTSADKLNQGKVSGIKIAAIDKTIQFSSPSHYVVESQ